MSEYAFCGHRAAVFLISLIVSFTALADPGAAMMRADGHAPIGVMGDHRHKHGEWMFSYRYMYMDMDGNRIGTSQVDPATIATTIPNRFFGAPMQPATLRVVPTRMTMSMHMFGAMQAPTDWLTLMLMAGYIEKEMDHITFRGGAGTIERGRFTTESDGISDTRLSALIRLYDHGHHHLHLNFGGSIPTGSNTERDTILTPTGATPRPRLPYAMQIGSGTFDLLPGLTYSGRAQRIGWGSQYLATVRTGSDNGYSWGDRHEVTGWLSYQPVPAFSGSVRVKYETLGRIDGIDPQIVAPVQTANPDNYGGDTVNLLFGLNWAGQAGWLKGKRLALEAAVPLMRDLNGPQMETDFTLTLGLQVAL